MELWCCDCLADPKSPFPMFHPETKAATIYDGKAMCFEHHRMWRKYLSSRVG